ncbi:MAG: hypothetical protein P8I93_09435 [Crocinitomicaceae bacterium]|nr:hypothetical protein [Crocinitomicaceae bacterium]
MRKISFHCILLFLVLGSCTTGISVKENNSSNFLNDGSSKVWLVTEKIKNDHNFANTGNAKELLIFYNNGNCVSQTTEELSLNKGKVGEYEVLDFGKRIKIQFEKENWEFDIKKAQANQVHLIPTKNSDHPFFLTLTPYPQLLK